MVDQCWQRGLRAAGARDHRCRGHNLRSAIDQQYQDAATPGEMDAGDEDDPDRWRLLHGEDVLAQLVEIAIRALSPAVNDAFTALSCIDWLTAGLCHLSERTVAIRVLRDSSGVPRVVQRGVSYERVVNGAFDKVRQASRGMPAVAIRQLSSLGRIVESAVSEAQRAVLLRQADMIMRASDESVPEAEDLEDIRARY